MRIGLNAYVERRQTPLKRMREKVKYSDDSNVSLSVFDVRPLATKVMYTVIYTHTAVLFFDNNMVYYNNFIHFNYSNNLLNLPTIIIINYKSQHIYGDGSFSFIVLQ